MEFISDDDFQHPYLHHRNVLNPYTSAYAHPDYLGGEDDFDQDDEPCSPDDEESGGQMMRELLDKEEKDKASSVAYSKRYSKEDEDVSSYSNSRRSDHHQQGEGYPGGADEQQPPYPEKHHKEEPKGKPRDDYNPKTDGKKGASSLEEKLSTRLEQLKAVFNKRFNKFSEFCSWNCFFGLLFVVGVLLVFLDHYGSAYVRMVNMQKFFFFVMGVLTTAVAVVVVCVVVAFTSCYGDGI